MALTLWLTDRSRYEEGTAHCPRARYLRYHAGPHGYGYDLKAQSIPTVTGTLVHGPLATILTEVGRKDALPTDAWIQEHAIQPAIAEYHRIVERRGLRAIVDADDLAQRVVEQTTLLEGLVWAFVRVPLPEYHRQHRVVFVEEELPTVIGCTCGLGDGVFDPPSHEGRGCGGIVWMTRGDAIAQRRGAAEGTGYRYDEFKTTGDPNASWEAQWYHRVQLVAGVLGAEEKLSCAIDEVYIHPLLKGRRQAEWDPMEGKASGPKYQATPLVYGGRQAANLPMYGETWSAKWGGQFYTDVDGKRRKTSKEFVRTGIWELPEALWRAGGATSPSDYWTAWIGNELLAQSYKCVGPIYRAQWKLDAFKAQLVGEERRWQQALWELYEASGDAAAFHAALDRLVPQVRGDACESFFGDRCPFLWICDREPGWEDPLGSGRYVMRRPHHAPELEQAVERGLLPAEIGEAEEAEE